MDTRVDCDYGPAVLATSPAETARDQDQGCHRLKSLTVVGGFLDGLHLDFADGLNCLIGARGTGKTTVLEFIRYALDDFSRDDGGQARRRAEALVKSNLGDGRIRLTVQTKDGLDYIVDRTASGEPMVLTAEERPTDIRINAVGFFGVDAFSQNEVENIADSPQSQLALIDKFAAGPIAALTRQVTVVCAKLEANANALIAHRRQWDDLSDDLGALAVVESKIQALAAAPGDEQTAAVNVAHEQRALRDREQHALDEARDLTEKYRRWLGDAVGRFAQQSADLFEPALLAGPNGSMLATVRVRLQGLGERLDKLLNQAVVALETGAAELALDRSRLLTAHQHQELAFRDLIARHNHARGVATERAELEKKRTELYAKQRRRAELRKQIDELQTQRRALSGQLAQLWADRFALRQQVAQWISAGVASPIRVHIDQCGDRRNYQQALAGWLKGFLGQYNPTARKLADFVPPAELRRLVAEGRDAELQAQAELSDNQIARVMEALGKLAVQLQLDMVELVDLPRIELRDGETWKNSLQLSTGQKCTTILPILLLESDNPLLIDQPEDNLDNRYIYDTVVSAIQRVKQRRQVILITHNPNIPVLGEAAGVNVLTSDGGRSYLCRHGSVDACKAEIINLLEGGQEAFVRRKDRYNY